jgi:HD-like signal output (HDOD) protein
MKRVLFVDDEAALLDGLRGRLRSLRSRWEMVFVESGARAIAEMELAPFDVLVTDMRMPGMDGAHLLNLVSGRWPEMIRIMLSGYSEEQQVARLISVAHQYLSKPCDANQLENAIDRCVQLHELLREPRLRAIVGRIRQLPALPRTCGRLRELIARDDVSVKEVAEVIAADSAIAAKVLQIVNSSFFRLGKRITRIEQAVTHLGFIAIRNIAMSVEVFSMWRSHNGVVKFDPERMQEQAQEVAAVARALTHKTPLADDALLAGLLHNIGYGILMQECPQEIARAVAVARAESIPMHQAERAVMGASHAEIGAYLLGLWGLPHAVLEAVAFQHQPQQVQQKQFDVLAALSTAHALLPPETNAFGFIEAPASNVGAEYLGRLNAPFDWARANELASGALEEAL